jgi:hypothetical protein
LNIAGAYFSAFVCRTRSPSQVVLVATAGKRGVRVVRKLA